MASTRVAGAAVAHDQRAPGERPGDRVVVVGEVVERQARHGPPGEQQLAVIQCAARRDAVIRAADGLCAGLHGIRRAATCVEPKVPSYPSEPVALVFGTVSSELVEATEARATWSRVWMIREGSQHSRGRGHASRGGAAASGAMLQ